VAPRRRPAIAAVPAHRECGWHRIGSDAIAYRCGGSAGWLGPGGRRALLPV